MKQKQTKTLEETVEAVRQAAEDSNILDEVLAMKAEQVNAELAKAGVDVDAVDARLAAREAEIRREQNKEPRTVSRQVAALLAAACAGIGYAGGYASEAAVVAARIAAQAAAEAPALAAPPSTTAPAPAVGEELRRKAFEACGRGHWRECLDQFDEAKAADPDGDVQPEVQDARARAQQALHR